MPDNNKTDEFLQKLAPCIERGELENCVEEAARLAGEMGIGGEELFDLATQSWNWKKYDFAYVLILAAAQGIKGKKKAGAYYNAGLVAQSLGKLKKSEEHYKLAIAIDPKLAAAHYNYANLLKELNRKEEAEEQYKLAIDANPKYAAAHYNYANLLKELNRKEEAEEQYKLAIDADPKHAKAHSNYAILLHELNRKEEAEEQYKLAIDANPKYAAAHYNYAILLQELNRKEEAEEQYKLAIDSDSKYAIAHSNYANLLKELNRKEEAEEQYKLAIDSDPEYAVAHSNYAILLKELNRKEEAGEQYKLAIDSDPKLAVAHSNYANLLKELNRKEEAEEQYKLAIDSDPEYVAAYYNYAILLQELNRKEEAEEQYKLAIDSDPEYAAAYYNYAILLQELNRKEEAEEQYKLAIDSDPEYAAAHSNYAILLQELNRKEEAEEQYKLAIDADPMHANAHGAYGLLLIELDKRKDSWKETEIASNILKETGYITLSYLAKAWFYERYSEKNLKRKRFRESGEDADKAGAEYLKAAETVEIVLKDEIILQGNVLKAKSFVRKIPEKSRYRSILHRLGWNANILEIIENLKKAAIYYEKASQCHAGERKDVCSACFFSISVFSETLNTLSAFMNGGDAEINEGKWLNALDMAHKIYTENNLNNGVVLVDTLKQLIKCVNELAEHRKVGLHIQEERLGKCYSNLLEVSEKLDGALRVIGEHSVEAIRDYAKKQGMGFIRQETKVPFWVEYTKEIVLATAAIIATALMDKFFSLNLLPRLSDIIKFLFRGTL